jgi:SSS family solute:Na+ symporter
VSGFQFALVALIAFFALVGISTYILVRKSGRRFVVAGKQLPLFLIGTMLFAQSVDANGTLGNTGAVYGSGFWWGFQFPLGLAICLLVTGSWFAKPLNRMNLLTLPDYYYRRYGNVTELIVSVLMTVSFIILVAGNLAGCGWIIHIIFGLGYVPSLIIISMVVLAYTFSGGLFSCAATDIVQLYPALVAFVVSVIWLLVEGGGWSAYADKIPSDFFGMSGLTSFDNGALVVWAGILALGIGDIVALDFMERVFAAKTPTVAQRGCYMAAGFTLIVGICASLMGLMAFKLIPGGVDDPRSVIITLATASLPFLLGLFVLGGIIGAGLSTANGGALGISAVFARNIMQRNVLLPRLRKQAERDGKDFHQVLEETDWHEADRKLLWYSRFMLIPVFAAAIGFAVWRPEPGMLLVLAFDVVFAGCVAPLILGIYWKKANTYGALVAVIVGTALRLVLYYTMPVAWAGLDTLIPPVVSFVLMVAVSLMTQKQSPPLHEVNFEAASDADVARALR